MSIPILQSPLFPSHCLQCLLECAYEMLNTLNDLILMCEPIVHFLLNVCPRLVDLRDRPLLKLPNPVVFPLDLGRHLVIEDALSLQSLSLLHLNGFLYLDALLLK